MSNTKHLADLLKVCSILPALVIMPAVAETITVGTGETQTLTGKHTDVVVNDGAVYFLVSDDKSQLAVLNIENATISNVTTNYANKQSGFVKGYDNSKVVVKNSEFSDNKSDYYSAIWTVSPATGVDGGILEISNSKFLRNEADDGAAIGAMWLTKISNTLFEANKATDANGDGGVLFLGAVSQSKLTDVVFKSNSSAADGGAIAMRAVEEGDNSRARLDILDSEFKGNNAAKKGGAIYSTFYDSEQAKDSVYIEDTDFVANSAKDGGAIYNEGLPDRSNNVAAMKVADSDFVGNIVTNYGGAIYNASKLVLTDSEFSENDAFVGGALFLASGSDTTISDTEFDANTADYGGAIYTATGIKNVDITNASFTKNVALGAGAAGIFNKGSLTNVLFDGNKATDATEDGGGALFLGALAQVQLNNVDFKNNTSAAMGGAIAMRGVHEGNNKDAKLDVIGGSFTGNTAATNGGAIFSTFYDSENVKNAVFIKEAEFSGNVAERGGAIYTEGKADLGGGLASMKIEGAKFTENTAKAEGAAIHNRSTMNITDSVFADNIANGYYGGAIYNSAKGVMETLGADFSGNQVVGNGFAIGGAIANIGKIGSLTGDFYENKVDAAGDGASAKGAAIYTYAGSSIDSVVSDFMSNHTLSDGEAIGGAVVNDGKITKLHQSGKGFVNNTSDGVVDGWAGALYNSENALISELVADFAGNKVIAGAQAFGGALVNKGNIESLTGSFTNNSAIATAKDGKVFGGAIYNEGNINFVGDVVFSNNTANGAANDIYNLGYLNIVSGTVSMDGGVRGTGSLVLAEGATLDIANTTIKQTTIELNGTVKAALVNNQRGNGYGRFVGDVTIGENALFELNVGATGTYDIWSGALLDKDQVKVGIAYEVADINENGVTIVTKAADSLAEDAGITTQAAGTVAGLANSSNGKAHQVSLALQDALNSGNTEFVEAEVKKLNPDDKPVVQAAATSIQNQVLALTAGRMAGGVSVGRAGGDASQENAFWIQGLFNKSKFADKFHGYTRGVAMGADTLIDKTWTIGGGLAFNNSDVHSNARHTSIDSKTLFGYMQYKPNKWFVNATATYNMSEYTENITAAGGVSVSNTFDVDSYGAQIMTGYDFATGITTELGARYLHVAQDGYTDELGLVRVDALDTDFLSGVAGLKYAFAIENDWAVRLRPELRAAMTYDIISDDSMATVVMPGVASYKVHGDRLSRMGGEFGIGLTALYNGIELSVMYDLDLHRDYTSQTGMIKFRAKF